MGPSLQIFWTPKASELCQWIRQLWWNGQTPWNIQLTNTNTNTWSERPHIYQRNGTPNENLSTWDERPVCQQACPAAKVQGTGLSRSPGDSGSGEDSLWQGGCQPGLTSPLPTACCQAETMHRRIGKGRGMWTKKWAFTKLGSFNPFWYHFFETNSHCITLLKETALQRASLGKGEDFGVCGGGQTESDWEGTPVWRWSCIHSHR